MFKQAYLYGQLKNGVIPDIYVQSKKYWEHIEPEIKQLFGENIGYIDKVSLQIRRGDYMSTDFYVNLTKTNYYEEAVKYFPNDKFLVFCHDRQDPLKDKVDKEWVEVYLDNLIPDRYEMWEPTDDPTKDLNAMASCKSNIMANGTFSWWASYLNPNENKQVICPKQWFTDGLQRCDLLKEWIKI